MGVVTLISAQQLTKRFRSGEKELIAINQINLHVKKGEFIAVMGPSGSGKSTLLQILGGLDTPTQGEVILDGVPVQGMSEKQRTLLRRRKAGYIFQDYQLLPTLTVFENIAFPMMADRYSKVEIQLRVSRLIKEVGLDGKGSAYPSQLSGGQQQRVAIARALAMQPRLILADEPTGNLDRKRGKEILETLSRLHREEGLTIILVTHDLLAASYAERVLLLKDGRIESDIQQKEGEQQRVMEDFLAKLNA